ncbi:MAG: aspartate aminotransferase family protein [Alphaproteobacteria bacterium]
MRADIAFEQGEGAYLIDTAGPPLPGFLQQHRHHPATPIRHGQGADRAGEQAGAPRTCSNQERGQQLVAASFFCNSGAEAIECGLKMVRKYQSASGHPERFRVITTVEAFHGRTLATIAAGGQAKLLEGFGPVVEGFDHVPFGNLNLLRQAITRETAGILVEPIQGEGGITAASAEYLKGLRRAADEFDLLLFFDEVQTGMGRTGKLFAHEWSGMAPDVMALAKGAGGGFPIGICLANERAAKGMKAGSHGSTFGGNPLATAVGNAVLDVIQAPGFLDNVVRMGKLMRTKLEDIARRHSQAITEVRGMGLMVGIKCAIPNGDMVAALRGAGLLSAPAGDNVVRLLPPLIIGEAEVAEAARIIETVCAGIPAKEPAA